MQAAKAVHIYDLPPQCLQHIFSLLPGKAVLAAACASRSWRQQLKDEHLWKGLCRQDWGLEVALWPNGGIHNSFRETYLEWQRQFPRYGRLAPRACRVCTAIYSWYQRHVPDIAASFRPGVTEAELDAAAETLGVQLPPALRVLYRFLNGQDLAMDAALDAENSAPLHRSMLHGALGSYQFYDHVVSVRLLPLARAVRWTRLARQQLFSDTASGTLPLILFAASFNFNKMLLVDIHTGIVKACLSNKRTTLDAVPPLGPDSADDGVLRWLEEFAARVAAGRYQVATFTDAGVPRTPALSLFDLARPNTSEAVTRGVRITATPMFVPEHSKLQSEGSPRPTFFFAYCIRMALLSTSQQKAGGERKPLKTVQLRSRRWRIRDSSGEPVDDIFGEGVISEFPVLTEGGPDFSYTSCMNQGEAQGSMEGAFSFAPGNLTSPSGPDFEAQCPPFQLVVPNFIF